MEKFARGKCCLEGNILSLHMCEMCLRDDLGRGMFSSDLRHREGGCTCLEYAMEQPCPCGLPESWRDNFSGTRAFGPMVSLSWARRARGSWAKNRARRLGLDWPPPNNEAPGSTCQAGCAEAEAERDAKRHAKRKQRKRKLLDIGAELKRHGRSIYDNNKAYTSSLLFRLQEVEALLPHRILELYDHKNGARVEGSWLQPTNFVTHPQSDTTPWLLDLGMQNDIDAAVRHIQMQKAARMMDSRAPDSGTDTTLELEEPEGT